MKVLKRPIIVKYDKGMVEEIKYQTIDLKGLLGRPLNDIESKYGQITIYYKGPMEIPVSCPRVSIIGSRGASEKGLLEAKEITKILIENEVVIVSGLAKGIDTVGHKTAIEYGGTPDNAGLNLLTILVRSTIGL